MGDLTAGGETAPAKVALAIVVPTLGTRPNELGRLLDSIAAQTRPPAEILVVVPHEVEFADLEGARTIRAPCSLPAQRKAGVEAAVSPVVLFLDDDIVLAPDFCDVLLEVWERRGLEGVAGVTGTIANEEVPAQWGQVLRAAGGLSHVARRGSGSRLMASGHVRIVLHPPSECRVGFMPGGLMSMRRDLLRLEPPDTRFTGYVYGEDLDLVARISRHGPLVQTPLAAADHLPVDSGLGDGPDNAYRRARQYAFYRGLHRRTGLVGRAAWHWANCAEGAIVAVKSARRGDSAMIRAYISGLRETGRALRDLS
jgi:GT2 family glycosyltransferase